MPLGNGDIGLNVWMEESGDLVFYIGKTDAWSETARLLKLGRVRVRLSPNPFVPGEPFRQTLNLSKGEIVITAGKPPSYTKLTLWVDANNPVIRVEAETPKPVSLNAFYERWRDQQRMLEGKETESAYGMDGGPEPLISYPDSIALEGEDRVAWYHRNPKSIWPLTLKHQGLEAAIGEMQDPLLNRTFGAAMEGDGMSRMNPVALRSKAPATRHAISIYPLTSITASAEEWLRNVDALAARMKLKPVAERRSAHEKWWQQFWSRSWIEVSGNGAADAVTRGYVLQRFVTACAGRGAYPIKFNGSIFTVDAELEDTRFDADFRRWGGPYWFQNTRLVYWPMLAAADFDMMQPLFDMFADARRLARTRTKLYFGHDGVFFPETMYFWGAYANSNYGWKRDGKPASWVENTYISHYYSNSLELLALMMDYYAYTDDKQFLRSTLVPLAEDIIRFYDQHYKRDEKGMLLLEPAQSLETWPDVVNPAPDLAGLRYTLAELQRLKIPIDKLIANTARRLLQQVPPLPVVENGSKRILAAAAKSNAPSQNSENPELYSIFPFRLYGVNKPDYEVGRFTFDARKHKGTGGWRQDAIQAAYLGMSEVAREYVVENFSKPHPGSRFPAFWGPNFDWVPDQDHGAVAQLALQSMLMVCDGDKILLFPAWPKDWDVDFKLSAPRNTTVDVSFKKGQIQWLKVTPPERAADVLKLDPQ
jgi:hypothetical protein